jgi:glyoxylase-like metal-dependent hydrolase (beta-lactamase superfamily II)
MKQLTRRALLGGTAAAGAALSFGFDHAARAAAPLAGKQNAGFYRYKVGDFEVTVVTDGVSRFKLPDTFVANVKADEVKNALAAAHMDREIFNNTYTPIVVNTGSKLVLIDTGMGEAGFAQSKGAFGQTKDNMAAAGLKPENIDTVIISHYHGDHVNGLVKADNSPAYPNAEILVPAVEHKFWMDDGEMSRAGSGRMEGLFKNNRRVFNAEVLKRVRTYEWGKEVVPGITAVDTSGHSFGHTSLVVQSGNSKVFVQGDVTHVPYLFARNPGWHLMFDQDPNKAEATRRKTYDMLASEKMMVQGFHYPFPAHAYIEKTATGYRETMVPWNAAI